MPSIPAAIIGSSVVGGIVSSNAAGNAAQAQVNASNQANATQLQMFNTANQLNAPWRNAGGQALNALGSYFIPGYQPTSYNYSAAPAAMPSNVSTSSAPPSDVSSASPPAPTDNTATAAPGNSIGLVAGPSGFATRDSIRSVVGRSNPLVAGPSGFATPTSIQDALAPAPAAPPSSLEPTDPNTGMPYTASGNQGSLTDFFYNSPGYLFRLGEGQNQLDRMAAKGGNFFSGRALRGAQEYGQNFASNEFGHYINQLNNIAGLGQTSAGQSAGNAMNLGSMMGQNFQNSGAARAGSYLGQANAFNNTLGNVLNYGGYAGWFNPTTGAAPGGAGYSAGGMPWGYGGYGNFGGGP